MFNVFFALYKNKSLLISTTMQTLRHRFSESVLGVVWFVLYPIIFLSIYSLIFIFVLNVRAPGLSSINYVIVIFSGLVPFLAFSEAFSTGTASILANRGLLRNTLFPIEMVVARDVIIGCITMGFGILLTWGAALCNGYFYWTQLIIPFIFIIQIFMTIGIVWVTSTLVIFFRDLQQAIPIIILFLMLISPIGYTPEMVPLGMQGVIKLNPLAWLIQLNRSCLLNGTLSLTEFIFFVIFSFVVFILGYRFISRLKPIFCDYV